MSIVKPNPMPMDEIERLEIQIDDLREAIERSRRYALAGRAAAVAGPALLVGFALGVVGFTPARMILALALAIGGLVLTGSSRASTDELRLSLQRAEAERNAAINALGLVDLGEGNG
jgi:hypothetical protein